LFATVFVVVASVVALRSCSHGLTRGEPVERPLTDERSFLQGAGLAAVWANDGADKVTRAERRASADGRDVRNSVWDGNSVSVFGARNEVVSFNLLLEAPADASVEGLTVALDSLTASDGTKIGAARTSPDGLFSWVGRNIELFYVRYLQIKGLSTLAYDDYDERHIPERFRRPWVGGGRGMGDWTDRPDHDAFYPDIAVPLELVGEIGIPPGQNQSLWVDIYIPKDAKPGSYLGTMTLAARGQVPLSIPVRLTVRDFSLPDVPTARTMLYLGYEDINKRYLGEKYPVAGSPNEATSRLIRDRHFQLAHRHRISLIDGNHGAGSSVDAPAPEWLPRLDGRLFSAAKGYEGPGRDTGNGIFSISTYGGFAWRNEGEAAMRKHSDAWVKWFEVNAPDVDYFLYLIDEPGEDKLPQVEQWAKWLNDNPGPGSALKSLATISFVRAQKSTPSVDIPTTWAAIGITDDWQRAVDELAADPDKRVYMYNGKRPASGSFAIEDDGVALRELAWGQYKMGVERWFYWESTYYNNFQGGAGETNVFETAQTFGGKPKPHSVRGQKSWNYSNGCGVLFYPGTDKLYPRESYGVLGPLASLRLKHWRRGIQDVDYLALAAKSDPERVAGIVQTMVPKVLWEYGVDDEQDPTWVRTDISWTNDPDAWEAARSELADIIEAANQHTR
jgi:hypothetical protein